MQPFVKEYKRIVIKIGSSILCSEQNRIDLNVFKGITEQVSVLIKEGHEVLIVSSGAIALGMRLLGFKERPRQLNLLQAVAAIGQNELMDTYRESLRIRGLNAAQVLLTWDDFDDRRRYLNAKNTLLTLLKLRSVPIVNENDTVSTEEIKFGDNDRLSALVCNLVCADLLVILSDVEGLLDQDKKTVIRVVEKITPHIVGLSCPTTDKTCVGGMVTKLEAARIAVGSGVPCIIANGRRKDALLSALREPFTTGTIFIPQETSLTARKRWIAFGSKPKGKIIVDAGAKNALLKKKSLLSVGVVKAEGNFQAGEIVAICDKENCVFARGRANLSSRQLNRIKGRRYEREIVHCDNIVPLS